MHILARSDGFKLKCLEYGFLYCKHAAFCFTKQTIIDHLEWCGLIVDYCDVFINCLDSHSDGTHSSYVTLNFSKYFSMKKKLIYILDGVYFQQMFIF